MCTHAPSGTLHTKRVPLVEMPTHNVLDAHFRASIQGDYSPLHHANGAATGDTPASRLADQHPTVNIGQTLERICALVFYLAGRIINPSASVHTETRADT